MLAGSPSVAKTVDAEVEAIKEQRAVAPQPSSKRSLFRKREGLASRTMASAGAASQRSRPVAFTVC